MKPNYSNANLFLVPFSENNGIGYIKVELATTTVLSTDVSVASHFSVCSEVSLEKIYFT